MSEAGAFDPWKGEDDTTVVTAFVKRRSRAKANEAKAKRYEASAYDVDEFYFASTNGHDHGEVARIRMDPEVHALLNEVLSEINKAFGADVVKKGHRVIGTADFVRDAVVHRAHYLKEHGYPMIDGDELARMEARGERNTMVFRRKLDEDDLTANRGLMETLWVQGAHDVLEMLIERFETAVMPSLHQPFLGDGQALVMEMRARLQR